MNMEAVDKALIKLSQRINKDDREYWGDISIDSINNRVPTWICGICNCSIRVKIKYMSVTDECMELLTEHGLNHLKEHGLLALL